MSLTGEMPTVGTSSGSISMAILPSGTTGFIYNSALNDSSLFPSFIKVDLTKTDSKVTVLSRYYPGKGVVQILALDDSNLFISWSIYSGLGQQIWKISDGSMARITALNSYAANIFRITGPMANARSNVKGLITWVNGVSSGIMVIDLSTISRPTTNFIYTGLSRGDACMIKNILYVSSYQGNKFVSYAISGNAGVVLEETNLW